MKSRAWALLGLVFILAACGSSGSSQSSPAAVVNGHDISMEMYHAEFAQQLASSIGSIGYDACTVKGLAPACHIIKQRSLNNVIDNELVREYAVKHGITVKPAEDSLRWKQVFQTRFDKRHDVERVWLRRVGISEADLRRSLHDDLLEQKVIYAITSGLSSYQPSIRIAQIEVTTHRDLKKVEGFIKQRIPFLSIAVVAKRDNMAGCSSAPCGDLGWTPDSFVPSNRKWLLSSPIDKVVGPIKEQLDWIFFQVEARSPHVKLTTQQLYLLRQQKFASWVGKQQKLARVKKYIAV